MADPPNRHSWKTNRLAKSYISSHSLGLLFAQSFSTHSFLFLFFFWLPINKIRSSILLMATIPSSFFFLDRPRPGTITLLPRAGWHWLVVSLSVHLSVSGAASLLSWPQVCTGSCSLSSPPGSLELTLKLIHARLFYILDPPNHDV